MCGNKNNWPFLPSLLFCVIVIAVKTYIRTSHNAAVNQDLYRYQTPAVSGYNNSVPAAAKPKTDYISKEEVQQIKKYAQKLNDAGFIYGYVELFPANLKEFCTKAGYVPDKYINEFNLEFSQSRAKMNEILQNVPESQKDWFNSIMEIAKEQSYSGIPDDYKTVKALFETDEEIFSKADYCKLYDDNSQEFIQETKKILKKAKPDWFLD